MKKIFPIITILIFISLLGIIFFQIVWIKQALQDKEQQFEKGVSMVTVTAANDLADEKGNLSPFDKRKNADILFPLNVFPTTIVHKFSREEIRDKIQKAFEKNNLKNVEFEFAVTTTSMIGDDLQSQHYMEAYLDSVHNLSFVYPIQAPSGSLAEGLSTEELLIIVVPHVKDIIWKQMYWMVIGAILFTCIIFAAFFITIRALLNQKKLSEIKSDFINNMTHEFKTPLATISLAVDALKNEKVINDRAKMDYFSGIIKDENRRMNKQVETILQAALLDKQEIQLNEKSVHAHDLIKAAVNNITLPLNEKNGTLETTLNAKNDLLMGDEVHLINIINNLLDNAIKYSKENLVIKLSTQNVNSHLRIKIEDNGIGMNKETLHRIFEKFYRAHTGNIHNVKGFGLGLSYVKTIVDAHKGKIKAESTPGKGSCFSIDLPVLNER
ncbi:MAG: HAMP domain-containing sensor histidine kinase [Ginsengibacter sp.]